MSAPHPHRRPTGHSQHQSLELFRNMIGERIPRLAFRIGRDSANAVSTDEDKTDLPSCRHIYRKYEGKIAIGFSSPALHCGEEQRQHGTRASAQYFMCNVSDG